MEVSSDSMLGSTLKADIPLDLQSTSATEHNYGYHLIAISSVFFYCVSKVASLAKPAKIDTEKGAWRWKNHMVSLVHSIISSVWAILCFYERPDMAEDLISVYSPLSRSLIAFSIGYFISDFLDLLINQPSRESYELLGHHTTIIVCFMVPIATWKYVGYGVVALIVELNSIFLHTRQLQNICGLSKFNFWYRLNSLINLGTFIVFRILLLAWMTRWILINKDLVPFVFYTLGNIGLVVMVAMNIVLFYRLLRSDLKALIGDSSSKKTA